MSIQRFDCLIRKPSSFRFLNDIFIFDSVGETRRCKIRRLDSFHASISFEYDECDYPWMMLFGDNRALLYRLSLTGGVISFIEKGFFDGTSLCLGKTCSYQVCPDVPDRIIECVCDFFSV